VNYLLDTCVISELVAKRPHPQVVEWIDQIDPNRAFLSVITIGEIRKGIEKLRDSKRRETLESWLKEDLLVRFEDHLIPVDVDVILVWGALIGRLEAQGRPMPAIDSLIAATALHGGFTLVTRNEADFRPSGVELFNPWDLL
jgi:toxin FitB